MLTGSRINADDINSFMGFIFKLQRRKICTVFVRDGARIKYKLMGFMVYF
jgi:hypothetical protein